MYRLPEKQLKYTSGDVSSTTRERIWGTLQCFLHPFPRISTYVLSRNMREPPKNFNKLSSASHGMQNAPEDRRFPNSIPAAVMQQSDTTSSVHNPVPYPDVYWYDLGAVFYLENELARQFHFFIPGTFPFSIIDWELKIHYATFELLKFQISTSCRIW